MKIEVKSFPILNKKKENCCGCTACYAACPVGAISMEYDKEGFLYPIIDEKKCTCCYLCLKMCAFKKNQRDKKTLVNSPLNVYAVKHRDYNVRMASRSGGVFTALSDIVLEDKGIIYGCILTKDFKAVHIRAEVAEERNLMRGSKYIQSEIGDVFQSVKLDLENGKMVLFSGTSCQVSGLLSYLNQKYTKLLCVDIICHGVPSPKVWDSYLNWQENKHHSKCVSVDFRNKVKHGWKEHIETLKFAIGKKKDSKIFTLLFYEHSIFRPCCYQCPYKSISHPGDITIADYWGIEKAAPGFSDNKGVSLVLINNDNGSAVFEKSKSVVDYQECKLEDSIQAPMKKSVDVPQNREAFWEDFNKYPFEVIAKKYAGYGIKNLFIKVIKRIKKLKQ